MGLRDDAKRMAEGHSPARGATPEWGCATTQREFEEFPS